MTGRGWCGNGPYDAILPGTAGGGGFADSRMRNGPVQAIRPGWAGGGGQQNSGAQPRGGASGGGNTGPSVGVAYGYKHGS